VIALLLAIRHREDTTYCLIVLIAAVIYLSPILLNKINSTDVSRWLACSLPPLSIVALSVTNKFLYPDTIRMFNYLDVRFFLIGSMVIPILVVDTRERILLVITLSISALSLILLDPIFNMTGVGYETLVGGVNAKQYYFAANFFSITSYVFILFSLLFEKNLSDKALNDKEVLISFLNKANQEIASQNTAIKSASDELKTRQDQLMEANVLIEKQKQKLLAVQSDLKSELVERNKELTSANEELSKYNHELQQFSYTISHNLRGPLARLLGLTNLMEKDLTDLKGSQLELVKLVSQSAGELDEVIRDLGKIIDIRNDIFRIREKVFFQEEWRGVYKSLSAYVLPEMKIETDFRQSPLVFTVRPILSSILFNLASNAIKYRSPDRALNLNIRTSRTDDGVMLEVSDNGLGIDLGQNDHNVFGLYKRFHTHTEGKGLGLYLVKLQIESLGGNVQVESEPNVGTTFKVAFHEPVGVEGQTIFETDFGSLTYNARTNGMALAWKKQVTSEEYRKLISKALEVVRIYRTPFWISDLRKQGVVQLHDQQWMASSVFPEAISYGMRKVAHVYEEGQNNADYRIRTKEVAVKLGAELEFFTSYNKAEEWIETYIQPVRQS
jgi:signal transduction histidine kinase